MTKSREQVVFFVECCSTDPGGTRRRGSRSNRVGSHASAAPWLAMQPGNRAYLVASRSGRPKLVATVPHGVAPAAILARLDFARQSFVLMLVPKGRTILCNGLVAPPVTVLRIGDQVEWDAATVLHFSALRRPYFGPARPEDLGNECPLCRVRFTEQSTVLVCVHCGAAMHCESHSKENDAPLECATLSSECPRCGHALVREEGFAYVPKC